MLRELGPSLGAAALLLDGELVGEDLWIGDLLHLDGRDVARLPFRERYALLNDLPLAGPHWRLAPVSPAAAPRSSRPSGNSAWPGSSRRTPSALRAGQAQCRVGRGRRARATARRGRPGQADQPAQGALPAHRHDEGRRAGLLPRGCRGDAAASARPAGHDGPVARRGREALLFFVEKDVSRHAPSWIRTARVGTPGGRSENADFPLIDDVQGLAWAANLAALELHVPQWRLGPRGARHHPDLLVFDLDPGEGTTGRRLRARRRADRRAPRSGRARLLPAHQRGQGQ